MGDSIFSGEQSCLEYVRQRVDFATTGGRFPESVVSIPAPRLLDLLDYAERQKQRVRDLQATLDRIGNLADHFFADRASRGPE